MVLKHVYQTLSTKKNIREKYFVSRHRVDSRKVDRHLINDQVVELFYVQGEDFRGAACKNQRGVGVFYHGSSSPEAV